MLPNGPVLTFSDITTDSVTPAVSGFKGSSDDVIVHCNRI
jgi:hypothetical protein